MKELETGWNESKIERHINNNVVYSAYLEGLTDEQGEVLFRALSWSIKSGCFHETSEEQRLLAHDMWEDLNQIFGE